MDHPLVQTGGLDALGQTGPGPRHDVEAALGLLGLAMVGGQAEPDPGAGVPFGAPARSAHVLQDLVVGVRVLSPAEPLLDGGELGRHQSLAGEHERGQGPGHAPVAVLPRMDLDEVEVGHGGADVDGRVEVALVEPVDELRHQSRNVRLVRCGVGGDQGIVGAGDVDGPVAPAAGAFVEVMALEHEVQAVEQTGVVTEVVSGVGEGLDVGHAALVALQFGPRLLSGLQRFLTRHEGFHVVDRRRVPLDGVRSGDRAGGEVAAQLPGPAGVARSMWRRERRMTSISSRARRSSESSEGVAYSMPHDIMMVSSSQAVRSW